MGLFDWLKRDKGKSQPEEPIFSELPLSPETPMASPRKMVNRATRIPLDVLGGVVVRVGDNLEPVGLVNISISGVGFRRDSWSGWPEPGELLPLQISVNKEQFELSVLIARTDGPLVGAAFMSPPIELQRAIENYFDVELLALSFVKIDRSLMKEYPRGEAHWIQGENNSGIYYVLGGSQLIYFSLSFLGNYVESPDGQKIRFGQLQNKLDVRRDMYESSTEMAWSDVWSQGNIEMALRFLRAVPEINATLRSSMEKIVSTIPSE